MRKRCLLLCCLVLSSARVFGASEESCRLLAKQEAFLTKTERGVLDADGFVIGTGIPEGYPNIVISKKMISGCDERYLAEAYFSNKISGDERFIIERPFSDSQRRVLSETVCVALGKSQVWSDGVSHEVLNTVSADIFPEFFDCIVWRVKSGKTIGPEFFTEAAFAEPSTQLLNSIKRKLKTDRSITSDQIAIMLFVLKNGHCLPKDGELRRLMENSMPVEAGDITNYQIIERALGLLANEQSISLSQARAFDADIWGLF